MKNRKLCPVCKGTGWATLDDGGQGTSVECRCGIWQAIKMSNRLAFAALPEAFRNTRIDNFNISVYKSKESQKKISTAVGVIEYWVRNLDAMKENGTGLYLYSFARGNGKTRMAASIANELIYEKHMQVKFATSLQILNEIKSTWNNRNKSNEYTESRLLYFLSTAAVLIIDDFGMENFKDWMNDTFNHIINNRYNERKITIFTSNYSLENLEYDERIKGRIKERSFQIPFPEESIREVIAKQNMLELIDAMRKEKST